MGQTLVVPFLFSTEALTPESTPPPNPYNIQTPLTWELYDYMLVDHSLPFLIHTIHREHLFSTLYVNYPWNSLINLVIIHTPLLLIIEKPAPLP